MRRMYVVFIFCALTILTVALWTKSDAKSNLTSESPKNNTSSIEKSIIEDDSFLKNVRSTIEKPVVEESSTKNVNLDIETTVIDEEFLGFTKEEISLLALVAMAEAEGESDVGKRLVIDTILNRVDSVHFPDTVYDVVYQKSQFSCIWNGRIDRCYVQEDIYELVKEEITKRLDYDVVFFNACSFSIYGIPMYQSGNHYFSKYS